MNGCEADYNKPPQKRLKRPLGENLVKLLFGLIQLIGSTHPKHRRTGRGGEGGCSPPKFWATEIFWAARATLGKASF